jgi:hypothetical protein
MYAFYCASGEDCLSPLALLQTLWPHEALAYWIAGGVALATYWCCARTHRQRLVRTLQLLAVAIVILLLAWGIQRCFVRRPPGPIWVTRYLGFTWPAFAIAAAVLLRRLPLLPIRWAAIALFLCFNLLYGLAPVWVYARGPVDVLARDILDAQGNTATTQTYLLNFYSNWGLETSEGRYYLFSGSGKPVHPREVIDRDEDYVVNFPRLPFRILRTSSKKQIPLLSARKPLVQRLILWDGPIGEPSPEGGDDLLPVLDGWRLARAKVYGVYDNGGWVWEGQWRRREYLKLPAPATAPATTAPAAMTR